MIYLFTGVPGAGKTLNAIKFITQDKQFQERPVYYFNVKGLTLDWIELSEDGSDSPSVYSWFDLPHGSIVLIDECQSVFPQRGPRDKVPNHVSQLNTHRHLGIDIVIITQHPKLIDAAVRRLVGCHFHFERAFGFNRSRRLHWQECQDDTKDYHTRKEAVTTNVKFDKRIFNLYKSAEVHTHKARIPPKLVIALALPVLIVALMGWFISDYSSRIDNPDPVAQAATPLDQFVVSGQGRVKREHSFQPIYPIDPVEYLKVFKPRIEGLVHTAPVYDEFARPQRAPKTICIRIHRGRNTECSCYTEQATKINVPLARCNAILEDGLYDPTIPPDRPLAGSPVGPQSKQVM